MKLLKAIGKQMQYPKGFFGKVLFAWMIPKAIAHARWTADLLEIQPEDKIIEIGKVFIIGEAIDHSNFS